MKDIQSLTPITAGLDLTSYKLDSQQSNTIESLPIFEHYIISLKQHAGSSANPCVNIGDHVLKGQLLAKASNIISAPVHAPTSGIISKIDYYQVPRPASKTENCKMEKCILLESDKNDKWCETTPISEYKNHDAQSLIDIIDKAGIVGLGGAGFPSATKMNNSYKHIHTLVINGVECEPYITADNMLMRTRIDEIVKGINILCHIIKPTKVIFGIKQGYPLVTSTIASAIAQHQMIELVTVPQLYPAGDASLLIYQMTGEEIPSHTIAVNAGFLCFNVGTVTAINQAINGKPLISRITTLTGDALNNPCNVEVLIGTPISKLLSYAGIDYKKLSQLIHGGPMMGFHMPSDNIPIIKTTNCIIASSQDFFPKLQPEQPCIRCGDCATVCPALLLPQQLYWYSKPVNVDKLDEQNLFDCIECGACAYTCPSHIPLVEYFQTSKDHIRTLAYKKEKSELAKHRYDNRQLRIHKEQKARQEKRQQRQSMLAIKTESPPTPSNISEKQTLANQHNIELDNTNTINTDTLTLQLLIADLEIIEQQLAESIEKNDMQTHALTLRKLDFQKQIYELTYNKSMNDSVQKKNKHNKNSVESIPLNLKQLEIQASIARSQLKKIRLDYKSIQTDKSQKDKLDSLRIQIKEKSALVEKLQDKIELLILKNT